MNLYFVGEWNYISGFVQRRKLMDFTFTRAMMKLKKTNTIKFPIGAGNQRKFAPNPSAIRMRRLVAKAGCKTENWSKRQCCIWLLCSFSP